MSPEDYWDGDNDLVKAYRKAHELKMDRENTYLWLQGLYFYHALIDASPVLNALMKEKKPRPYLTDPIPITKAGIKEQEEKEEQAEIEKARAAMRAAMTQFNQEILEKQKKGGGSDGS